MHLSPLDVLRPVGRSALCCWLALAAPAFAPAPAAAGTAPQRVVSTNLCTDQMAMLMAAPGQLKSVSFLATEEGTSAMADEAARYPLNHGQAEEIFLLQPDLVLAGTYTAQATVGLLRNLGFRVEQFAPASSFEEVRNDLLRMGALLHREQRAAELVAELDAGLADLAAHKPPARNVAIYYANSYTSGSGTLADAIVQAAGLTNLGDTLGFHGMTRLPLELLVAANPDIILEGDNQYGAPALARQNFSHPAFTALTGKAVAIPDKYTICGAPFTLEASRMLQRAASGAQDKNR